MFDADRYLLRLRWSGSTRPDHPTLVGLHRAHLRRIPYDNSAFPQEGRPVPTNPADLDVADTFDKVVVRGRGGICFELSLLFQHLLDSLGFRTTAVSGGVAEETGGFSPDLSHKFILVTLDGAEWLADVGFAGPSYIDPVRLSPDIQEQYGCQFRVLSRGDRNTLLRRSRSMGWHPVYEFTRTPRELSDWDDFATELDEYLVQAVIGRTTMLCRAMGAGHQAVVGKRHLVVEDGKEKLSALVDPADYERVVTLIRHPSPDE